MTWHSYNWVGFGFVPRMLMSSSWDRRPRIELFTVSVGGGRGNWYCGFPFCCFGGLVGAPVEYIEHYWRKFCGQVCLFVLYNMAAILRCTLLPGRLCFEGIGLILVARLGWFFLAMLAPRFFRVVNMELTKINRISLYQIIPIGNK